MMLPTQDSQLKLRLFSILEDACTRCDRYAPRRIVDERRDALIMEVLSELEKRGYHAGLSASIEEALNSGDGVYRP